MTIITDFFHRNNKYEETSLEDTVEVLSSQLEFKTIQIAEAIVEQLKEQFGDAVVQDALDDTTSVIARFFTYHYKPSVKIITTNGGSKKKLSKKEKGSKISSVQEQMEKCFGNVNEIKVDASKKEYKSFKHFEDDIAAKFREGNPDISFVESVPELPDIKEYQGYFERIKDVANAAREVHEEQGQLDGNDYAVAREFAESEWPFLGLYINGHSILSSASEVLKEVKKRIKYAKKIDKIDHKDKRLLQLILRSYPDKISKHPQLQNILVKKANELSKDASLRTITRRKSELTQEVDSLGLSLGDEIKMMYNLFEISNQAMVDLTTAHARKSEVMNRNSMFITGSGDNKVVMKLIGNPQHFQYEIAASEMAELAGFKEVCLPTKRGTLSGTTFNDEGDIVEKEIGVNQKSNTLQKPKSKKHKRKLSGAGNVLMQKYEASKSGLEYMLAINKRVNAEKQNVPSMGFLGQIPRLTGNYKSDVEAVLDIDQQSFELNILNCFILGDNDANPGNTLYAQESNDIFSIDHEAMMPESNKTVTLDFPVITKMDIGVKTGQITPIVTEICQIDDVCPIHNWLIGLPLANKPFSRETINKVLGSLNREAFVKYHRAKKLFSDGQVAAQLERIDLVLSLFSEEDKKGVITLTPRELYLKVVGEHPTYKLLKEKYNLADYFLFQLLGKVPTNVDNHKVSSLSSQMTQSAQKKILKQLPRAAIKKQLKIGVDAKYVKNPYFAAANVSSQIQQMQELQRWMNESPDLYYLIWGEEKPKPKPAPMNNMRMGMRPFFF